MANITDKYYDNVNTTEFLKNIPGSAYDIIDVDTVINSSGDFRELKGIDAIVNGITQILMTEKGTYLFNPEYGVGLQKYLFEPNDEITKARIKEETVVAIKTYEPRVAVNVSVTYSTSNKRSFYLNLEITYRGETRRTTIPFDDRLLKSSEDN